MTHVEFVGLPGTGKSTLSQQVADKLSSSGVPVFEPTRKIETRSGIDRVILKSRFVTAGFLRDPGGGYTLTRATVDSNQESLTDVVRVLFNLLYVNGVVSKKRSDDCAYLMDQGIYQGIWSAGFRSSNELKDTLARFKNSPLIANIDLVVFVEADEKTISNRLRKRTGGDTRFKPEKNTFERGIKCYEELKSHVLSLEKSPQSIVVNNDTQDVLQPNAIRIANDIQAMINYSK